MWLVYLAIPCGSGLMSFRFLQVAWNFWRTGELPHHDPTDVAGVEKIADQDAHVGLAQDNLFPAPPGKR